MKVHKLQIYHNQCIYEIYYIHVHVGVYFDNLTADSADIKYSLRFSDMYYLWNTDSVSDQFNTGSGATFSK